MADEYQDQATNKGQSDVAEAPAEPLKKTKLPNLKPSTKMEEEEILPAPVAPAKEEVKDEGMPIFALRTTANKEDQVMDFISSNAAKKGLGVYAVVRPHGMRGYIFIEAVTKAEAEQAAANIPYARGILPQPLRFKDMEHLLEQVKVEANIQKDDIAEIISGPFKREKCKVTRVDRSKEEVVVELLEAAVPIPITLKFDAIKVIRREGDEARAETSEEKEEEEE
ncbi:transcription elongation factor Spt5 [Candidatus Woesearchaeota archaeon]|nr:transcription elongation factor Spt5 [Candidatus Woesearchaeota archaeon]